MDAAALAMVMEALTCGVTGCVEWEPKEAYRLRSDKFLKGLTPESIQQDLISYVTNEGGEVVQIEEKRPQYSYRVYWYKVIVPYPDLFRLGLFVELELFEADPDCPVVHLLNAHEQTS
ncbi:MAG TPA: hypothetical protein VE988_27285 [Gemmataceae bacterium]|nr:hypothetical protein [Gemmataceae bacterium]